MNVMREIQRRRGALFFLKRRVKRIEKPSREKTLREIVLLKEFIW